MTLLVASWGLTALGRYDMGAGAPARAPLILPHLHGRAKLLVFLHPRCPCSRATISQLKDILRAVPRPLADIQIDVVLPRGAAADFARADYLETLATLPSAQVQIDSQGQHAGEMGVETSGQFLAYAADGHLVFAGGITPGRGVDEETVTAVAVREWLASGKAPDMHTEVYGCPLQGPSDLCGAK